MTSFSIIACIMAQWSKRMFPVPNEGTSKVLSSRLETLQFFEYLQNEEALFKMCF